MKYTILLVEVPIACPRCGQELVLGDIMYRDDYRATTLCGYCKDEYEKDVIVEEGENGELLK